MAERHEPYEAFPVLSQKALLDGWRHMSHTTLFFAFMQATRDALTADYKAWLNAATLQDVSGAR
jgi:hypothetical protein